jgi:rare lipoprotein A
MNTVRKHRTAAWLISLGVMLTACVPTRWEKTTGPVEESTAREPARSSRGNPPVYEVFGRRYYVLSTSAGHKERGVASWYGRQFHGKPTSSGELYDMYAMTAAHKTLPIPTRVRVTNQSNGKSVIVRVNDRGPFVNNRIIDLSYAAARSLDMIGSGTALVEIEALTADSGRSTTRAKPVTAGRQEPAVAPGDAPGGQLFMQVGAFGERLNARRLKRELENQGLANVHISFDGASRPALYRVRLGPIANVLEYDALAEHLATLQIVETQLVMEPPDSAVPNLPAIDSQGMPGG